MRAWSISLLLRTPNRPHVINQATEKALLSRRAHLLAEQIAHWDRPLGHHLKGLTESVSRGGVAADSMMRHACERHSHSRMVRDSELQRVHVPGLGWILCDTDAHTSPVARWDSSRPLCRSRCPRFGLVYVEGDEQCGLWGCALHTHRHCHAFLPALRAVVTVDIYHRIWHRIEVVIRHHFVLSR